MKRTQLFVPERMHVMLSREAQRLGISVSELARRAIDQYFDKSEKNKK